MRPLTREQIRALIQSDPEATAQLGGALGNWQQRCAEKLVPLEQKTKAKLVTAEVLHVDETGMRGNGQLHWLHTVSPAERTFYGTHPKRGTCDVPSNIIQPLRTHPPQVKKCFRA